MNLVNRVNRVNRVNGVTAAIVGVSDRQPHLDLYRGRLGFGVTAEGEIHRPTAAALWGAPAAVPVRTPGGISVTLCEPSG